MAAYSCGVKTVLLPEDNVKDLAKIDEEARAHLRFVPCKTIQDVLANALVRKTAVQKTAAKVGGDRKAEITKVPNAKQIRTNVMKGSK